MDATGAAACCSRSIEMSSAAISRLRASACAAEQQPAADGERVAAPEICACLAAHAAGCGLRRRWSWEWGEEEGGGAGGPFSCCGGQQLKKVRTDYRYHQRWFALPARNRQQTTREHRKLVTVRGTPAGRDARSQIVLQNAFVSWRRRQTAYPRLIDFHPRAALNNESQCKLVRLVVG